MSKQMITGREVGRLEDEMFAAMDELSAYRIKEHPNAIKLEELRAEYRRSADEWRVALERLRVQDEALS